MSRRQNMGNVWEGTNHYFNESQSQWQLIEWRGSSIKDSFGGEWQRNRHDSVVTMNSAQPAICTDVCLNKAK